MKTADARGTKTVGAYIGTALRHCRRAAELNLKLGPSSAVAASARDARDALDGAIRGCEHTATRKAAV